MNAPTEQTATTGWHLRALIVTSRFFQMWDVIWRHLACFPGIDLFRFAAARFSETFLPKLTDARHFCCMKKSGLIEFLALTPLTLPEGKQRNGRALNRADHSHTWISTFKLCCPPNLCSNCTKHNNAGWTETVNKRATARRIKVKSEESSAGEPS